MALRFRFAVVGMPGALGLGACTLLAGIDGDFVAVQDAGVTSDGGPPDAASCVPADGGMLVNADFEENLGEACWKWGTRGSATKFTSTVPRSCAHACRVCGSGMADWSLYQTIEVPEAGRYEFTAALRATDPAEAPEGGELFIVLPGGGLLYTLRSVGWTTNG